MPGYWTTRALFPAPYDTDGSSFSIVMNGRAYIAGNYGRLFEWDGESIYCTIVADPPSGMPVSGMSDLAVYDGVLYGAGQNSILYRWNGVDAWEAIGNAGQALYSVVGHDGKIYTGTGKPGGGGHNAELWEYDVSSDTFAQVGTTGPFGVEEFHFLLSHNGYVWAGTSYGNYLLRWNGAVWEKLTDAYRFADQTYSVTIATDGEYIYGATVPDDYILRWNGVDEWEFFGQARPNVSGYMHYILWDNYRQKLYGIINQNGILISYDKATDEKRIEATEAGGSGYTGLFKLNGNIYGSGVGVVEFVETATIAEPEPATSGDIRLFPKINSSELQIANKDLARDPGLETAVFISLFTERRVDNTELLTSDNEDKRGWWANNDFGSRLWLLYRAKTQDAFTARAEEYAKESLQWLIDDDVISDVQCNAEQDGENLILHVSIYRPDGSPVFFEYYYNWNYQIARRL